MRSVRPPARWEALAALAIIVAVAGEAMAQRASEGVPLRLPPGARFDTDAVRFNTQSLNLATQSLRLPSGFGVPVGAAGTSTSEGRVTLPGTVVGAPPAGRPTTTGDRTMAASGPTVFVAADPPPPDRLPSRASLGSSTVSLDVNQVSPGQVNDVTFGSSASNLGGGGTGFGGAVTDLGGMTMVEENGGFRFTLGADVLFDFDKSNLRPEADPILRKLVEEVSTKVPRARYMVEGHTDAKGSDAYNFGLSNRRARAVRDWLQRKGGVAARDVTTIGFGESQPVAPNENPDGSDNPEGRQKNRRVEIIVTPLP